MTDLKPQIGSWYKRSGGTLFEVVAIDDAAGTIEVQDYDGTVDEIEMETWRDTFIAAAEAPEDWSGSLDMEKQDYAVDYDDHGRRKYDNALEFLDETREP